MGSLASHSLSAEELQTKPVPTAQYIKANEGLALTSYKGLGGYTLIGYGRNLETRGISKEVAELLLQEDIQKCREQLDKHYPWHRELHTNAQTVLIDLCYNVGFGGLSRFKRMMKWLYGKQYDKAAIELLDSRYARTLPNRARRNVQLLTGGSDVTISTL